ncbi:hypothetical protein RQP46_002629 [Phenoliferia psychrophenolica]
MAPPGNKVVERKGLFGSTRHLMYLCTNVLIWMIAASELGLVSYLFQHYGNNLSDWPTPEFKYDCGLILFLVIYTLLLTMGHGYLNVFMGGFFYFAGDVMWGAAAGVLFQVLPFKSYTCDKPASFFSAKWAPFKGQCGLIVGLEALAWTEWGLMTLLLFGIIYDTVNFSCKRHEFYELPVKGEQVDEKAHA